MTGRRLYEKYTDALGKTQASQWNRDLQRSIRCYPINAPVAWPFLPGRERSTWNMLARLIAPRERKVAATASPGSVILMAAGERKIAAIKAVRNIWGLDLKTAKLLVDDLAVKSLTLPLPPGANERSVAQELSASGMTYEVRG